MQPDGRLFSWVIGLRRDGDRDKINSASRVADLPSFTRPPRSRRLVCPIYASGRDITRPPLKVNSGNVYEAPAATSSAIYHKVMGIFSDVTYTLSSSLRANDQKYLTDILDANGATRTSLEDATHIISDTPEFEGWQSAPDNAEVVIVSGHGTHPHHFT